MNAITVTTHTQTHTELINTFRSTRKINIDFSDSFKIIAILQLAK